MRKAFLNLIFLCPLIFYSCSSANYGKINALPQIESACPSSATEDILYECNLKAFDKDFTDVITFELQEEPEGMELSDDGIIEWIPTDAQSDKTHEIIIEVSDGEHSKKYQHAIDVKRVNDFHLIISICDDSAIEDEDYFCQIEFLDEEGFAVTYALDDSPEGMEISDKGLINWTPQDAQAGNNIVNIIVADKDNVVSSQIVIEVFRINDAPIITSTCEPVAYENTPYECILEAFDEEGDELKFTLEDGIGDVEGDYFLYTTYKDEDADDYEIKIEVSDGENSDEYKFTLTVLAVNDAPTISHNCENIAYIMQEYSCVVEVDDEEQDPITFFLKKENPDDPIGMEIADDGFIHYSPTWLDTGLHDMAIQVSDGENSVTEDFDLNVFPNPAYGYAMLSHRLKGKQFLFSVIHGKVGQVSPFHDLDQPPSHVRTIFYNDIFLKTEFSLDFHPDYRNYDVNLSEGVVVEQNVSDPEVLPTDWPAILNRTDPETPVIEESIKQLAIYSNAKITGGKKWVVQEGSTYTGEQQYNPSSPVVEEIGPEINGHAILMGQLDKDGDELDDYYGENIGCLNISGTLQQGPVNGVIVVDGDLIIRGQICGKGAIYVRRNIYIVDSLTYKESPVEPYEIDPETGDYELGDWESVKASEQERLVQGDPPFDKLELYAGGNILFGNIALFYGSFDHINKNLNYDSSGTVPIYNDEISTDNFYQIYLDKYCGGDETNCGLIKESLSDYRIYERSEPCSGGGRGDEDCVLSGNLRFYLYESDTCDVEIVDNGSPHCDPKGLYAMDGNEGFRFAEIYTWAGFDIYETRINYPALENDYDGDGLYYLDPDSENKRYENYIGDLQNNMHFTKNIWIETAGVLPQGSNKDNCSGDMDDYCYKEGWIKPDDLTDLAGYGEYFPGSIACEEDEIDPDDPILIPQDSLMYRIEHKKDGTIRETRVPVDGACACDGGQDSCYFGPTDLGCHGNPCFLLPYSSDELYCWMSQCSTEFNYATVRCNEDDLPPLREPFKAPRIYSLLYAEGAVTGYKKSNVRFYDKDGNNCLLESEGRTWGIAPYNYHNAYEWDKKDYGFLDKDNDGITFYGAILSRDIDVYDPWGGWYVIYDDRNEL